MALAQAAVVAAFAALQTLALRPTPEPQRLRLPPRTA